MKQMKILNNLKSISKAYTEGIYADTPANRKLGRVGMTYTEYAKMVKEEKEKSADKKHYLVKLSDGEEFMLEEGATSQEKAIELAINYAEDMVRYNGYKEFKFDLEENIDNWTDEQIDDENNKWDWFSIRAKKHGDKIEVSVYNWNTHEYLRNDTLKREQKNIAQQVKREKEKSDKEFQEKFGWMDEWIKFQQEKHDIKDEDITINKIFKNSIQEKTKKDLTTFFIKKFNFISGGKIKEKYQIPLDKRDSLWSEKVENLFDNPGPKIKNISIEDIVPSQDYLNPNIVREYLTKEEKDIPLGISIKGPDWKSSKIVLFNGHHRVAADILNNKKEIPIKIISSYNLFKHLK